MKYVEYFKKQGGPKVLYLPLNNLHIRQTGMEKAFVDLGFDLCSFDFFLAGKLGNHELANKLFLEVSRSFKPDWIHMQLQFCNVIETSTMRIIRQENKNAIITNWTGDVRNEAMENFVKMAPFVDKSLISSEGQLALYRQAGCKNLEYWQVGVNTKDFYIMSEIEKLKCKKKYDHKIAFCAGHKPNYQMFPGSIERFQVANSVIKKYGNTFGLYGPGWPNKMNRGIATYYEQLQIYNASEIALSINKYNDLQKYFSDRQLICMACGPLVISRYIPHMETFFENNKHLVWYKTIPECMDKIDYYLKNPQKAKEIGINGAKHIAEKHSYLTRLKELKERLKI